MPLSADAVLPLDDTAWLDETIGDARVVALGESAHFNAETYELRHRVLRHLVERHGFGAYGMENGFVEGLLVDDWVRGGAGDPSEVLAKGTPLMGLWTEMRDHVEWMRQHNSTAAEPVGFYGIDLGGMNASLFPGLDFVADYLARADPDYHLDPTIRDTATEVGAVSAFSAPAALGKYGALPTATKDALTAGLAELTARMVARRLDYVERTSAEEHERALLVLRQVVTLDLVARGMTRGDQQSVMFHRDSMIADTVAWILGREDRILLGAHNGHLQRWRGVMPGMGPMTPMGLHLADRLGSDYLVVGMTTGRGQTLTNGPGFYAGQLFEDMQPPQPGSLDALMDQTWDKPFAVDLRRLSAADADAVRAASQQRFGPFYTEIDATVAYDVLVHLPRVTGATPDRGAVARSPQDVQDAFANWPPTA